MGLSAAIITTILLLAVVVNGQCTIDFATSESFSDLIRRSRFTVLLAYNPQGKGVQGQLKELLSFASASKDAYEGTAEAVYCPHVVFADGISFDPFQEKAFNVIAPHVSVDTTLKDPATVHQLQGFGIYAVPSLLLLRGGSIISEWEVDLSGQEMLSLFRATVDSDLEKASASQLITHDDVLLSATDPNRRSSLTLVIPHFIKITDSLRRDIYSVNATVLRPTKGTTASKLLFSDKSGTRLSIYAIGPAATLCPSPISGTEMVVDADWIPSQWSRRLTERGLTLVRCFIERSAMALGSNITEAQKVMSMVVPPVAEGYRHFADLSAVHQRTNCTVVMFIKDATSDVIELYRERLNKVALSALNASSPERGTLGNYCTFMVADPDIHTKLFASFGFLFKSLYRSSQDLKGLPHNSALPRSRQQYSDNLIGVAYAHRRYQYQEKVFNALLLAQFVRRVLNGKMLRARKFEQFGGDVSFSTRAFQQLVNPYANSDTLYYDVIRDFRRDSIVVMLPNVSLRQCLNCTAPESCLWLGACSNIYGKQLLALNDLLKLFDSDAPKEVGIFYYVMEENDLTPYLKAPVTKEGGIQLLFIHRADKLEFFKSQPAYQPGVHAQFFHEPSARIRTSSISLNKPLDKLASFIKEASEALDAHVMDALTVQDDDSEEEF